MNKNKESWTSVSHEYRVRVEQDTDPEDPREMFDHAGHMVCWHRNYRLGDEAKKVIDWKDDESRLFYRVKNRDSDLFFETLAQSVVSDKYPEALLFANAEKIARAHFIILPLMLYDHSGISMSTSRTYPYNCPWDSGQVGWIYFPKAKLKDEGWTEEKAVECLQGEVKEYDAYIAGRVYGFIIERKPLNWQDDTGYPYKQLTNEKDVEWEQVDSCWGFLGEICEGAYDPEVYIKADLEESLKEEQKEIDAMASRLVNA